MVIAHQNLSSSSKHTPPVWKCKKLHIQVSRLSLLDQAEHSLGKARAEIRCAREDTRACLGLLGLYGHHRNLHAPATHLISITVTARTINVPRHCTLVSNALLCSRSPVLVAGLPVHDPSSWENIPPNSHKGCMRGLQSLTSSVQRNLCTTSHPIWLRIRGNSSSRVRAPGEWTYARGLAGGSQILS